MYVALAAAGNMENHFMTGWSWLRCGDDKDHRIRGNAGHMMESIYHSTVVHTVGRLVKVGSSPMDAPWHAARGMSPPLHTRLHEFIYFGQGIISDTDGLEVRKIIGGLNGTLAL